MKRLRFSDIITYEPPDTTLRVNIHIDIYFEPYESFRHLLRHWIRRHYFITDERDINIFAIFCSPRAIFAAEKLPPLPPPNISFRHAFWADTRDRYMSSKIDDIY